MLTSTKSWQCRPPVGRHQSFHISRTIYSMTTYYKLERSVLNLQCIFWLTTYYFGSLTQGLNYLRCLDGDECKPVLQEMHDGSCGNHSMGRSLSNRTLRIEYYWPTLQHDADDYVKTCDACQRHDAMSHKPAEKLHSTIIVTARFPSC